jgi:hypothetical protein
LLDGRLDEHAQGHLRVVIIVEILIYGGIALFRMPRFEMALELITVFKCARAALHGARIFAINRAIDGNSTGGGTDLTSCSMHRSVMSIALMRSGETNVTLGASKVGHDYRLITDKCLGFRV